jgi:hypothetical protein
MTIATMTLDPMVTGVAPKAVAAMSAADGALRTPCPTHRQKWTIAPYKHVFLKGWSCLS